jgi:DNA-binding transcriptional MerR regulator/predicted transcriptional regulator YdeE
MLTIGDFARVGGVSPRMLRNYDELGLLCPERVDPATGYRWYGIGQLARLHRVLAFRDLGFTLQQIGGLLDDDLSLDELRGMLRLRQVQIEQDVAEEHARLRRVEAHLRALERTNTMAADIVTKITEPLRIAEVSGTAPGFGHDNIGPLFERLLPEVFDVITRQGARPGMTVAWYEEPNEDGGVVLHAGCAIADQAVADNGRVRVVDLPVVEVASTVHRGSMETVGETYEALVSWIEESGSQLAGRSRELYHEWDDEHPERCVTELQMPISQ